MSIPLFSITVETGSKFVLNLGVNKPNQTKSGPHVKAAVRPQSVNVKIIERGFCVCVSMCEWTAKMTWLR